MSRKAQAARWQRSTEDKKLMQERVGLVRLPERSADQEKRLAELDAYVHRLPILYSPANPKSQAEIEFDRIMEELLKDFPDGIAGINRAKRAVS